MHPNPPDLHPNSPYPHPNSPDPKPNAQDLKRQDSISLQIKNKAKKYSLFLLFTQHNLRSQKKILINSFTQTNKKHPTLF